MLLFDLFRIKKIKARVEELEAQLDELGYKEWKDTQQAVSSMQEKISYLSQNANNLTDKIGELSVHASKLENKCASAQKKLNKCQELYRAVEYSLQSFDEREQTVLLSALQKQELDNLTPTVTLYLHCMDLKDLKKAYKENEKQIDDLVIRYKSRYITKTNKALYDLMVIALRAEIQNILYALKYDQLEKAIENVKEITAKYLEIVTAGNKNIFGTAGRFIGELEYLFINAVKIEYNYYVKKEQARLEQIAIREQRKQEAEERKALEQERKRIEAEEQKYQKQIDLLKAKLDTVPEEEKAMLRAEIVKIESDLFDVAVKKDEITQLQHGKAGFIYIISNLGSFGENMFKIGMTRRIDPQDRVDELGDASVPFKFDVHSFIFSEDAVSLESELHKRLDDKRVNKVNLRKEFFYSTIDDIEKLTNEISPSAEFTRTMLAEEFRQSLASNHNFTSDFFSEDEVEDD